MKIATTTWDFADYSDDIEDILTHISDAGFKYIDYSFHIDYIKKTGFFSNDFEGYLKKVKNIAEKLQIKFVQAHAPMGCAFCEGENGKEFLKATKKSVKACRELGVENIVVHSGYEENLSKEETFERNRKFYLNVLEEAEKYRVNILTENFNKMHRENVYWIDNVCDERKLIDFVNHPLFHGCLDTGHNNMQTTPPDEAVKILGEHLYALHVQDNMGDADSHMAPFFGTLNLDSLMSGLIDVNYKGYFTFEADRMLKVRKTCDTSEKLASPPIKIRKKAESLLYDIGKHILKTYNCFEE